MRRPLVRRRSAQLYSFPPVRLRCFVNSPLVCRECRFLSTVYLVCNTLSKRAGAKRLTQAAFNLIIQRPRVAGGTLIVPIDATVRLVKCSGREGKHHTIRLRYGATGARKCLVMRASSSLEREKWLIGILAAMAAIRFEPVPDLTAPLTPNTSRTSPNNSPSSGSTCPSDSPSSLVAPALPIPKQRYGDKTSTDLPKKASGSGRRQRGGSNTGLARTNCSANITTSRSRHSLRQRAQRSLSVAAQFIIAITQAVA
jgi:hypothetical protein